MNWEDLQYFLALAGSGSLSQAARHLDVSPSTVSRRIERLEQDLRESLFIRRHDGYRLTETGASVLADAQRVEAQMASLERSLGAQADEPRGTVRIATPELLAHEIIIPALPAFQAANPGLSLELIADVRPVALTRRTADVVIRAVRPSEGEYRIRRIGRASVALFGAAAYLERCGEPRSSQDLANHHLIGWDHDLQYLLMPVWLTELAGEQRPWLRTNNLTAQFRACQEGLGLAVLPSVVARRAGLRRVLPDLAPLEVDLWLLVSLELAPGARIQRVVQFLESLFSDPEMSR
jgi:DNA-binding transcriptional LysR family regulator